MDPEESLMAGDWIKVRTDLPEDPAVFQMAAALKQPPEAIVGRLIRLWIWADRQTEDGRVEMPASWIDSYLGAIGFADAMAKAGWLVILDGAFRFPDFDKHNGKSAKKRAMASMRQAKKRVLDAENVGVTHVSRSQRDESVTREEKRREEKRRVTERGAPRAPPTGDPFLGVPVPALLDTSEFHLAWNGYLRMRCETRRPALTAPGVARKLKEWTMYPVATVVAALEHSTVQEYQGVFPDKFTQKAQRGYWEKSVTERLFEDIQRQEARNASDGGESPEVPRKRPPGSSPHGGDDRRVGEPAQRLLGRRGLEGG